jgi:molybdopterin-binding protein
VVAHSARNRFGGLVTRVIRDTVMAQVEIQAGPYRFVSLLSREATDELGLEPGMLVIAAVKATNVSVEIPQTRPPALSPRVSTVPRAAATIGRSHRPRGPACTRRSSAWCRPAPGPG